MVVSRMAASTLSKHIYPVVLSFCADDTGKNFSDHLFAALEDAGIHAFRGDGAIEREEIDYLESEKAMQEAKVCLVVFSKHYASSVQCLEELEKIMESRKTGLLVFPIFYDADPDQVWEQSGSYAEAFDRHAVTTEMKKVEKWKALLREITGLSGMDLKQSHEADFIQDVVGKVQNRLNQSVPVSIPSYLVGIDSRIDDINSWLQESSDSSLAIIHGIGGVGKTTIAKKVFNLNLDRFEGSCFLANVREASKQHDGFIHLQKQLLEKFLNGKKIKIDSVDEGSVKVNEAIGCKKVLLVFDDVDELDQLNKIIGMWDSFKKGSKIIVTTRRDHHLASREAHKKLSVKELNDNESLQLFSWHVFGQDYPIEGHEEHSKIVVKHCCGLPLALEVFGTDLSTKIADEWGSEVEKLKAFPPRKILENLLISYDSLQDDHDKNVFLHLACFFIGTDKDYAVKILDGCEYCAQVGIQNIMDRHLVTINEDNKLMMLPLIRDMARHIIRQESPEHPGSRSRLWHHEDVLTVLQEKIGTKAIKGLTLDLHRVMQEQQDTVSCINCAKRQWHENLISKHGENAHLLGTISSQGGETALLPAFPMPNGVGFNTKSFAKMSKLKLLQLNYVKLNGGYEHFPKNLIWLCWHGFPLKSIPSDLSLENLAVLDLRYSNLKHAWNGAKALSMLKILNLSHSHGLVSTPDLSGVPNLEKLKLKNCTNLVEVHKSIGNLNNLVCLNLKDCKSLRKLPREIVKLKSLEELILLGCSQLEKLPNELGRMESLKVFHMDGIVHHTDNSRQSTFLSLLSRFSFR